MSKTFEQGKDEIARLCRYFAANRDSFLAQGIKEAHVRLHLIDPLFECLGWDVRNTAMVAPQYREVVTEDSLEIEGTQKAPDYSFRVGTLSKYFGEAKKCGININADPLPAYQLRRYGWSAKVPLSILTDFEEFGVYDCSSRPKPADKASFGRLNYFRFDEYPDRWRELWDIFSRQAVWDGAFDKFAASRRKRGTTEVDGEFLKEIEGWRDKLAHNIALRNRFLAPDDLNSIVQRTIDRLIFLRMAEDRGSEPYGQLLKLCEQPDIYRRFIGKLCKGADEKYNSGLFHFQKEEGIAEAPDFLSSKLQVDDKVFKPILQGLYFEHGSPYHFGVLPVEILGTVYERFLGKVIRLTPEHRAKVEEKPEVRKAGGVYYTPAYIVDYIVKNTIGKMIEDKSPAQLAKFREGQPLRVLDMACGSGSFLLGAFQCLLDHALKWYMANDPEKRKKETYKTGKGEWRLTIAEKKRILTTHIFGVDIDPQAVEVSKLSLLLKVMEGETDETVGQTRMLFHERALPNLAGNIKCGNSLIGPDYFSGRLIPDPEELKRVNPFDWNREFPEAMKSGGFDCVIGNPPYLIVSSDLFNESQLMYLKKYEVASYKIDLFHLFIEKGIKLLKKNSLLGFITPNTWFTLPFTQTLRKFVLANSKINEIVNFNHRVFFDADVFTGLIFLSKNTPISDDEIIIKNISKDFSPEFLEQSIPRTTKFTNWLADDATKFELRISGELGDIIKKVKVNYPPLSEFARVSLGIQAYNSSKHTKEQIDKRVFHAARQISKEYLPELAGNDVGRYFYEQKRGTWVKYGPWLHDYRTMDWFVGPRILIREIPGKGIRKILACYIEETFCNYKTILNVNPLSQSSLSIKCIIGILNSKLLSFIYPLVSNKIVSESFPRLSVQDIKNLPISLPKLNEKRGVEINSQIEKNVNTITSLNLQFNKANVPQDNKIFIFNQMNRIDDEIDMLVYKLYGLNDYEIKLIEESIHQ